jgi:hypothetical protein
VSGDEATEANGAGPPVAVFSGAVGCAANFGRLGCAEESIDNEREAGLRKVASVLDLQALA